jgi:hypothetical protein
MVTNESTDLATLLSAPRAGRGVTRDKVKATRGETNKKARWGEIKRRLAWPEGRTATNSGTSAAIAAAPSISSWHRRVLLRQTYGGMD